MKSGGIGKVVGLVVGEMSRTNGVSQADLYGPMTLYHVVGWVKIPLLQF